MKRRVLPKKITLNLYQKFALLMILVGMVPMIILTTFITNRMMKSYYVSMKRQYEQVASYAARSLDNMLETYNTISKLPYYYNQSASGGRNALFFDSFREMLYGEKYSARVKEQERKKEMGSFLQYVGTVDNNISAAHFVGEDENGELITFHYSVQNTYFREEEEFLRLIGYEKLDRMSNQLVLIPPHSFSYYGNTSDQVITIARNYFDLRGEIGNRKYVGTLYVDVNVQQIGMLIDPSELENGEDVYAVDGGGDCFYSTDKNCIGKNISGMLDELADAGEQMVISVPVGNSGLEILVVMDTGEAFREIREMQSRMYIVLLAVIALVLGGSVYFSARLARPVHDMIDSMSEIENGKFDIELQVRSEDEIGILSRRFNQMSVALKKYIDQSFRAKIKQTEAELTALKSQIYPHFLYNTLEIIRMTAIEEPVRPEWELWYALSCHIRKRRENTEMKVILADDEEIITRGIQKLVDWDALGMEVVGVYEDGKSAFEGIMTKKPEIALLDISMPGMSGIEILKECRVMGVRTSVVFISGFQDFEYARDALKYGAVEYLLKPVIREELIGALEKCVADMRQNRYGEGIETKEKETDYGGLIQIEDTCYIPVLTQIIHRNVVDEKMNKLVRFSVSSFLDKYMQSHHLGISFEKNDYIVIIIKGMDQRQCRETLEWIGEKAEKETTQKLFFVMGKTVEKMSDLEAAFQECLVMKGYQFFAERLPSCVLEAGSPASRREADKERFEKMKVSLAAAVVNKDEPAFENYYRQFEGIVCRMANGKREDACFYFCSLLQFVQEKCRQMGIQAEYEDATALLEIGRNTLSYEQLTSGYCAELQEYMDGIRKMAESSDSRMFLRAKEYIEQHYAENLTLNILAEEVHMNPSYFSVFFKKNAGENFKAYVNRVRLEHAVSLMISTDKKTFDIAVETGFRDARAFSEAFQKQYRETPNVFRKRLKEKLGKRN